MILLVASDCFFECVVDKSHSEVPLSEGVEIIHGKYHSHGRDFVIARIRTTKLLFIYPWATAIKSFVVELAKKTPLGALITVSLSNGLQPVTPHITSRESCRFELEVVRVRRQSKCNQRSGAGRLKFCNQFDMTAGYNIHVCKFSYEEQKALSGGNTLKAVQVSYFGGPYGVMSMDGPGCTE